MRIGLVTIFLYSVRVKISDSRSGKRFSSYKEKKKREKCIKGETKHETTVGNSTKSYKHGTAKREAVVGVTRMRK